MIVDERELEIILTRKWQEYVERSLGVQGIDIWQEPNPYQVVAEKAREVFRTTRGALVEHFIVHGLPARIAQTDPLVSIAQGYKIYQDGRGWQFEYWERGGCCYAATMDSFKAAVKKVVDDQFPYLAE